MTIQSMTGFAQVNCDIHGTPLLMEARSVNSKAPDFRFRFPQGFEVLEPKFRAIAIEKLHRGSIQFSFSFHSVNVQKHFRINKPLLQELAQIAKELEEEYSFLPARVDGLLALDGVLLVDHVESSIPDDKTQEQFLQCFNNLIDELCVMREKEGKALKAIFLKQIDEIEHLTNIARNDAARSPEMIQARLQQNIDALFNAPTLDPEKIYAEAVLLATKADIQEELDRLDAHVNAARTLFANGGVIGRKLDFLAQEFNREANTLCSKANAVSLSQIGLALKNIIDQLREQVQNIV